MRVKPDIMDAPPVFDNKWDKFKYWFTNVYWFHYKNHTLIAVIAIAILVSIIVSLATKTEPDVVVVIVSDSAYNVDYSYALSDELNALVIDATGNEKAYAELSVLWMGETTEAGMVNQMLLPLQFTRDDVLLFIFEDTVLTDLLNEGIEFKDMAQYGFGDTELIDVSGSRQMKELFFEQDVTLRAGFLNVTVENESYTELSVAILEYLLWNKP